MTTGTETRHGTHAADPTATDRSGSAPAGGAQLDRIAEGTDLERRVLAHERILQTLIAHMAEVEPRFVERLRGVFGNPARATRQEHDYVDTDAYAAEFIEEVTRLMSASGRPGRRRHAPVEPGERFGPERPAHVPADLRRLDAFEVSSSGGVWKVAKNGLFYGDFLTRADARGAIKAARPRSAAEGRAVLVSWLDGKAETE